MECGDQQRIGSVWGREGLRMLFRRVTREGWTRDTGLCQSVRDGVREPERATRHSAGYDFFAPYDIELAPHESVTVPTGFGAVLDDDKFMLLVPRSGLGFKYGLHLSNTCGIIDADYAANAENEGHIWAKLVNGDLPLSIKKGTAFMQGIIVKYYTIYNEKCDNERSGGFGSTDR